MLWDIIHIINCISLLFDQTSFFGEKKTTGAMLLLFLTPLQLLRTFLSHFQTCSKHLSWLNLSCPDWGNSIDHLKMKKLAKYVCVSVSVNVWVHVHVHMHTSTIPLCMTRRECICSRALQSWTKYFHTVRSGISLLCFLKCCKGNARIHTHTHTHTHTHKIRKS